MNFTMRLNSSPFEMIENGKKTIELRLYDEKRRRISVGDMICFMQTDDESKVIVARVKKLYVFPSFDLNYSRILAHTKKAC